MRIRRTKHSNKYDYVIGVFWDKKNRNFFISLWRLAWVIEYPRKPTTFDVEDAQHKFLFGGVIPENSRHLVIDNLSAADLDAVKKAWDKPNKSKIKIVSKEAIWKHMNRPDAHGDMFKPNPDTVREYVANDLKHRLKNEEAYRKYVLGDFVSSADESGKPVQIIHTGLCGAIPRELYLKFKQDGLTPHGWTGNKCTACKGSGDHQDDTIGHVKGCTACAGTGDEYGELKQVPILRRVYPADFINGKCVYCTRGENYHEDIDGSTYCKEFVR